MPGETVSVITGEKLNQYLKEFGDKFSPDEFGRPRTNARSIAPQLGQWLEKVLGQIPGVQLPLDRSILANPDLQRFDWNPNVGFHLAIGQTSESDYIEGNFRVPYPNDPESDLELRLTRSGRGQDITGSIKFTTEGALSGGDLNSKDGRVEFDSQGVVVSAQNDMSKVVQVNQRLAIPKLLNALTTLQDFGKPPNAVTMLRAAKA